MKNSLARLVPLLLVVVCLYSSVAAKDDWTQVKSKNFLLIGNASEKDIKKVATRLEQFRATFQLLFPGVNLVSPIGTNVLVFKSESSYKPFKPKRADGKIDNFVAGYFQPGQDINYISLALGGDDVETYRTIFHEYVHFIVNTNFGKSEVPPWFNEGLAEYYSTFSIENDQVVKLGLLIDYHLGLLRETRMIPLDQLFAIGNHQLLNTGDHSRTIFYAESWALIHYLVQGGKGAALGKFLDGVIKGVPQDKAFKDAFGADYRVLQKELEAYVGQSKYKGTQFTFEKKLTFEDEMQSSPLPPAMSSAYLGDLLYHANRADDAEPFLTAALKDDPSITMAAADLGMVKFKQRKFDEARSYLETASKGDQKSAYGLYYYAYVLSREGRDDYGLRREYPSETLTKMRDALHRAIAAEPGFTQSYELLAYVDVASKANLDEAEKAMATAIKYEPGNEQYLVRLAEVYMDEQKFDAAHKAIDRLSHSDDPEVQERASQIGAYLDKRAKYEQQKAEYEQRRNSASPPTIRKTASGTEDEISQPELDRQNKINELKAVNRILRVPQAGEKRLLGSVERIDCSRRPIAFTIRDGSDTFFVTSDDFNALTLNAFIKDATGIQVGCDANLRAFTAVITYREGPPSLNNKGARGQLVAIEFVPDDFHIAAAGELADDQHPRLVKRPEGKDTSSTTTDDSVKDDRPQQSSATDRDSSARDAMRQAMRSALRQPADGEKREIAYLDKIDCSAKGNFFIFHTSTGTLRLLNDQQAKLRIVMYTHDLEALQIGCTLKPVEYPAVIVYRLSGDSKAKTQGIILSIEFMPKDFTLD